MSCPNNANMSGRQRNFAPRTLKKIQRNLERARRLGASQQGLFLQMIALNDYEHAKVLVRKHGGQGLELMV